MTQPGDTTHRLIRVKDGSGAAVTGLTLASFTIDAYAKGYGAAEFTTYTSGASITELGGGRYRFSFAMPAAAGWFDVMIRPVNTSYLVWSSHFEGEIETQDYDSLYGNILRPVATLTTNAQLGNSVPLELIANRYRSLSITIRDQAGATVDLSTYTNLKMSVRSKDQTTTKWDAGPSGTPTNFVITGSVGGVLSIEIPEDATFFAALTAGSDLVNLYWEVTGDMGGSAAKTIPIIRSSALNLMRREVGT